MGISKIQRERGRIFIHSHLLQISPNIIKKRPVISLRPTAHSLIKHKEDRFTESILIGGPGRGNILLKKGYQIILMR